MRGASVSAWNMIVAGVTPAQLIKANTLTVEQQQAFEEYMTLLIKEELIVAATQESAEMVVLSIMLNNETSPFQVDIFTDMEEMLRLDPIHEADTNLGWPNKA